MPVSTSVSQALRAIVGAGHVLAEERVSAYRLGSAMPLAVASPGDEGEVARVLRLAWEEGLRVVPWGGGAHQAYGYAPTRYDLALDLGRLNRLVEHEPADMTATAQAGIRIADLQRGLGMHRQFLPLDPPSAERATLGGVLATRLSGPLRCRYGTARDLVLGIRVAHADGTITKGGGKVVKNASAYDITKLYIGSHGTLGVILEASFRVYPLPVAEQGWWLPAAELETAQEAAIQILGSHLVPNRVELLDDGGCRACGGPGDGGALLVSCAGVAEAIQGSAAEVSRIASRVGLSMAEVDRAERTWEALSDFPWVNGSLAGTQPAAIWQGSVRPAECARAMRAIREATRECGEIATTATVAHGILRGGIRSDTLQSIACGLLAARAALNALGGFLVVLDAPAPVRAEVDVWGAGPDALGLMQRMKAAFDSKTILNPGRFVGGI